MTALGKQTGAELAKLTGDEPATYEREPEVIGGGYCVSNDTPWLALIAMLVFMFGFGAFVNWVQS